MGCAAQPNSPPQVFDGSEVLHLGVPDLGGTRPGSLGLMVWCGTIQKSWFRGKALVVLLWKFKGDCGA